MQLIFLPEEFDSWENIEASTGHSHCRTQLRPHAASERSCAKFIQIRKGRRTIAHIQAGPPHDSTALASAETATRAGCGCGSSSGDAGGGADSHRLMAGERPWKVLAIDFLEVDMPSESPGCAACDGVRARLDSALEVVSPLLAQLGTTVELRAARVRTEADARALRLTASPTIRIGGVEAAPEHRGTGEERVWTWRGEAHSTPPQAMLIDALLRGYTGSTSDGAPSAGAAQASGNAPLPAYLAQFLTSDGNIANQPACCGG